MSANSSLTVAGAKMFNKRYPILLHQQPTARLKPRYWSILSENCYTKFKARAEVKKALTSSQKLNAKPFLERMKNQPQIISENLANKNVRASVYFKDQYFRNSSLLSNRWRLHWSQKINIMHFVLFFLYCINLLPKTIKMKSSFQSFGLNELCQSCLPSLCFFFHLNLIIKHPYHFEILLPDFLISFKS